MTWSAPRAWTRSHFEVLATPVTCAPKALAICTAEVPPPPEAPRTRTSCRGRTSTPPARTACRAVRAEMVVAADWAKVSSADGSVWVVIRERPGDVEPRQVLDELGVAVPAIPDDLRGRRIAGEEDRRHPARESSPGGSSLFGPQLRPRGQARRGL